MWLTSNDKREPLNMRESKHLFLHKHFFENTKHSKRKV